MSKVFEEERIFTWGLEGQLIGILTSPTSTIPQSETPVVILLNAGLLHRVGPFRLYVNLSRALAAQGVTTLRLDLSGVGDSPIRHTPINETERAVTDVQEAMTALTESIGATTFILGGICWGADISWETARVDNRVKGIALLDGFAYRTMRYHLVSYAKKFHPDTLLKKLKRWIALSRRLEQVPQAAEAFPRDFLPHRVLVKEVQRLCDRGVRFFFIFSGGVADYYNHRAQIEANLASVKREVDQVKGEYLASADHTYSMATDRRALISLISGWISAFPRK